MNDKQKQFKNALVKMESEIDDALPAVVKSSLNAKQFARIALTEFNKNTKLQKCTTESVFGSLMQAAEVGLPVGGALGLMHLVPYGDVCTLLIDYKGLICLATRTGHILKVHARLVYDNDDFKIKYGTADTIDHEPADEPGAIKGAYSMAWLANGTIDFEYMPIKDIDAIMRRSATKGVSGPWKTDKGEMCKKTVLRRHLKRHRVVPVSAMEVLAQEDARNYPTPEKRVEAKVVTEVDTEAVEVAEPQAQHTRGNAPASTDTPSDAPQDAPEQQTGDGAPQTPSKPATPPEAPTEPSKAKSKKKAGRPKKADPKPEPPKPEMTEEEKTEHLNAQTVAWDLATEVAKEAVSTTTIELKKVGADPDETLLEDMPLKQLKEVTEKLKIRLAELKGEE